MLTNPITQTGKHRAKRSHRRMNTSLKPRLLTKRFQGRQILAASNASTVEITQSASIPQC